MFRLLARYFFLSCQEEVPKKKARPLRRPAAPGALRCSVATGGCGTRGYAPQTVLALFPVAPCAARRRRGQPENRSSGHRLVHQIPFGVFAPPTASVRRPCRPGEGYFGASVKIGAGRVMRRLASPYSFFANSLARLSRSRLLVRCMRIAALAACGSWRAMASRMFSCSRLVRIR